ncbi:aa3-type cytochrome c oxidase subunit IV [Parasphingopyxis marina]|uniref:Aa3-type cytochrome c oxidase subunit IV n=1 Tax=Parasphingopyxis marina TaxID=2761622 RepID=A0A842HW95_9SPHN|nr:aa3-type cytochrome c oxidase subunit IV [Parasphingopyxis marina]MBC2778358.1 aa3-type cytochrome c oxidase subunit IV [Parasphingopyxis marina]
MVETNGERHPDMDYPAHTNTYSGFLTMLKWGTAGSIILAIIAIVAIT